MLSDSPDDVFSAIFLTKVDNPLLQYDLAAKYPPFTLDGLTSGSRFPPLKPPFKETPHQQLLPPSSAPSQFSKPHLQPA